MGRARPTAARRLLTNGEQIQQRLREGVGQAKRWAEEMSQTSGTFPALYDRVKKTTAPKPPRKPKR